MQLLGVVAYALYSAFNNPVICSSGMAKREIKFLMGTPIKQDFTILPITE
jgi:outer membrane protein assembly factor BamE (lipoprotein component of BamABCDE complex)